MGEIWDGLIGSARLNGWSSLSDVLEKAHKSGLFKHKKGNPDFNEIASQAWDKAGEDADVIIEAAESTFRKRAGFEFFLSCLQSKPPDDTKEPDSVLDPATGLWSEPPAKQTPSKNGEKPAEGPKGPQIAEIPKRCQAGWVKFHRSIEEHWTFKDSRHWPFKIFSHLILNAAYQSLIVYRFGQKIIIERGEIDYTEDQLAEDFKVNRSSINRFMKALEDHGEISRRKILRTRSKGEPGTEPIAEPGTEPIAEQINKRIPVTGFTVAKLLNYDIYQEYTVKIPTIKNKISEPIAEPGTEPIAEPGTEQLIKNKEEIKNKEKDTPLTPQQLINLWNEHRGPFIEIAPKVDMKWNDLKKVSDTFIMMANNGTSPQNKWVEFIKRLVSTTHKSHYGFISPYWIAKDLNRIDQILGGTYERAFGDKNGNQRTEDIKKRNRGSIAGHKFEKGEGVGEEPKLTSGYKLSLLDMQRHGGNLESGAHGSQSVPVQTGQDGKGDNSEDSTRDLQERAKA